MVSGTKTRTGDHENYGQQSDSGTKNSLCTRRIAVSLTEEIVA
jgi:hypothetical protein